MLASCLPFLQTQTLSVQAGRFWCSAKFLNVFLAVKPPILQPPDEHQSLFFVLHAHLSQILFTDCTSLSATPPPRDTHLQTDLHARVHRF